MDENSLKIATNDPRSFPLRFLLARTCVCAQSCVVAVISIRRGIRAFFPFALHSLLINIPLLENHRTNEICLRIACLKKKPSKRKKISLWTIDRSFPLLWFHAPCLILPHHFSSSRSVSIFIYLFFFQDFSNRLSHLIDPLIIVILWICAESNFFLFFSDQRNADFSSNFETTRKCPQLNDHFILDRSIFLFIRTNGEKALTHTHIYRYIYIYVHNKLKKIQGKEGWFDNGYFIENMIAIKYYFIKQSGAAHLFRNLFDEEEAAWNISAMDSPPYWWRGRSQSYFIATNISN